MNYTCCHTNVTECARPVGPEEAATSQGDGSLYGAYMGVYITRMASATFSLDQSSDTLTNRHPNCLRTIVENIEAHRLTRRQGVWLVKDVPRARGIVDGEQLIDKVTSIIRHGTQDVQSPITKIIECITHKTPTNSTRLDLPTHTKKSTAHLTTA